MLSIWHTDDEVVDLAGMARAGGAPEDIEHLADATSAHTMDPVAALDEGIAEAAVAVADVLEAVHRLRRLRGLRRAIEEAESADATGSASPQERLQRAALLTDFRASNGSDVLHVDQRIADAEADLASRIAAKQQLVDQLRYLHTMRQSISNHVGVTL